MTSCGTYGGYQAHVRAKEKPCIACREACRIYSAQYRKANPKAVKKNREINRAVAMAQTKLAATHPEEYRHLYAQDLAEIREVA